MHMKVVNMTDPVNWVHGNNGLIKQTGFHSVHELLQCLVLVPGIFDSRCSSIDEVRCL